MVIINSQNAQLANRLWGFSSFIANSIEYNYPLVNLGFFTYRSYFEATSKGKFGNYPISMARCHIPYLDYFYSNLFKNWSSLTFRWFGRTPTLYKFYRTTFAEDLIPKVFDLNDTAYVSDAQKRKILVEGWMFRDPVNVRKHRDKLREFFKPVAPYRTEVQKTVQKARKGCDVLVGVHIRRGDYISFMEGRWHYSDQQYAQMMQQIHNAYKIEGKSCAFLICSNEQVDPAVFQSLTVSIDQRHFIVDLYALSECDAIVGPPSTFSQWAAFYNDKPYEMLLSGDHQVGIPPYNPSLLPATDFEGKELYRF